MLSFLKSQEMELRQEFLQTFTANCAAYRVAIRKFCLDAYFLDVELFILMVKWPCILLIKLLYVTRFLGLDSFCEAQLQTLMPSKLIPSGANTEGYVSHVNVYLGFSVKSSVYFDAGHHACHRVFIPYFHGDLLPYIVVIFVSMEPLVVVLCVLWLIYKRTFINHFMFGCYLSRNAYPEMTCCGWYL